MTDESIFDKPLMDEAVNLAETHANNLYEIPEKAFEEVKTTAYIRDAVSAYPLQMIDIEMDTGLACFLDAGRDKTVALRADIDAVPTELGPKHLCGHNAHAGTMLGAIHYLCKVREQLKSNVLFIFQPAEEGTRGAREMLEHGLFEKLNPSPSMIFGIHNRPEIKVGDVVVHKGPLMSEKSVFDIRINGKAAHASMPQMSVDPIVCAASLVEEIQTIISRNKDPFKPALCTVNSIASGDPNIASPEHARITGYIRTFDHELHETIEKRLRTLAEETAKAYECTADIEIKRMVPAVDNKEEMYVRAKKAAEAALGAEHVTDSMPSLASEDFAIYGSLIPSFFYWVGSGEPGEVNPPWHDMNFRVGEGYQKAAVPVLVSSVLI